MLLTLVSVMSILIFRLPFVSFFFFFNDTATTEIYTLSLHDALPISNPLDSVLSRKSAISAGSLPVHSARAGELSQDRKSTRLNSSHQIISYAVFCLKKKKKRKTQLVV